MADNEQVLADVGKISCKYCRKTVSSAIAKCIECKGAFHTSCALRIPGLVAIGKDNLVKCCKTSDSIIDANMAVTNNDETAQKEIDYLNKLVSAKEEIIEQMRSTQDLMFKTINLLEEKLNSGSNCLHLKKPADKINTVQRLKIANSMEDEQTKSNKGNTTATGNSVCNNTLSPTTSNLEKIQRKKMSEIINLQKDVQVNVSDQKDEGFTKVQYKKGKQLGKKRIGTGITNEQDQMSGFAGVERKVWLYIYRIKPHVTEDMIAKYINEKPNFVGDNIMVKQLKDNNSNKTLKSFVVTAPLKRKEEMYQTEFWPAGVGVKRFNFNLHKSISTGDFLE